MASYQQPPFYGQPASPFPPTPSSQDEFMPLTYYDASFPGLGSFDLSAASNAHPTALLAAAGPRSHSPTLDGANSTRGGRGSSEEKDLTPGQRRRKEQNRAAQRAFRERKERHVKELEARLASLEQANNQAAAENDKLKEQLEKTRLENRLLHENSKIRSHSPQEMPEVGPMEFKPIDPRPLDHEQPLGEQPPSQFTSPIFGAHPNRGPLHRITTSPKTGERLLGAGAAWDLIVCHRLYQQGLVDIGDISDRLKGVALCDGQGPVFEESIVLEAIHASSGSGVDELLPAGSDDY